jgi:hypothetical protein
MKYLYSFLLLCLVALSCSRCKEECDDPTNPECPNYVAPDPCANSREVSAEFVIEERPNILEPYWVETDTTLNTRRIQFRAKIEDATEYKWYIGSQVYSSPKVELFFDNTWTGSSIPITLVVRKTPDINCFPYDDGYDSLKKVFFISTSPIALDPNNISSPVIHAGLGGGYRMKQEGATDSIDIKVDFCYHEGNWMRINLENIDGNGTVCSCDPQSLMERVVQRISYREVRFGFGLDWQPSEGPTFCSSLGGVIRRHLGRPAEFEITSNLRSAPGAPLQVTTFKYSGRRL